MPININDIERHIDERRRAVAKALQRDQFLTPTVRSQAVGRHKELTALAQWIEARVTEAAENVS